MKTLTCVRVYTDANQIPEPQNINKSRPQQNVETVLILAFNGAGNSMSSKEIGPTTRCDGKRNIFHATDLSKSWASNDVIFVVEEQKVSRSSVNLNTETKKQKSLFQARKAFKFKNWRWWCTFSLRDQWQLRTVCSCWGSLMNTKWNFFSKVWGLSSGFFWFHLRWSFEYPRIFY